MRTWRAHVLRHTQLPESPDGFSSGTGHQCLYVYTVVYAVTQLRKGSLQVSPRTHRAQGGSLRHPGSRRERLPSVMNPQ